MKKLGDLVGKRIELLTDQCWAARRGFVTAGHRGTVQQIELIVGQQPLVHIKLDRIEPREGLYFGLGCADWDLSPRFQRNFRVIGGTA